MAVLLAALAGYYVVLLSAVAVLAARVQRRTRRAPAVPDADLPRLVVVVPARDEDHNLPRCLDALLRQDYPAERLEVVVADDHSTDGTAAVVERYREAHASPGAPLLRVVPVPDAGPPYGKAAGIDAGIEATDAPLILLTDADCAPPPGWCRAMAGWLSDPDVGLVCGRTLTEPTDGEGRPSLLAEAQAFDWLYLLTATAALTDSGYPTTAMGNNMGLRRAAYEAVGGYRALPFSVTEDHDLFAAVNTRSPWRVRYPLDPALAIRTRPAETLGEVYRQRRRWARGGMRLDAALWAFGTLLVGHLVPVAAVALAVSGVVPAGLAAGILAAKLGADAAFLWGAGLSAFSKPIRVFAAGEALLFFYLTTMPVALVFAPRVRWKGRVH